MSNAKDSTQKSEIIKAIPAYKLGDIVVIEGAIVKLGDGKFVTMRTENGLYLEVAHTSIFMVEGVRCGGLMQLHIGSKVSMKASVLLIKRGTTYSSISEKSDTVYQLAMEGEFSHVFASEGEITDLYKEDAEIFSAGDEVVYAGVALEIDPFDDRPIRMSDPGNIHGVWVPGEAVISINNDPGLSYKRCCVGDVVHVSATIRRVRRGFTYPYSLKIKGAETHCMATTASSITKVQNNEPPASEEEESEEVPFVPDPGLPAGTKVLVRGTICDVNALVYPDAPPLCISWGSLEGVLWLYAEDVVSVNGQPRPRNLEDYKVGDEIVFRCALTESSDVREVNLPTGGLNWVPAMSIIGYDDKVTPVEEPAEVEKSTARFIEAGDHVLFSGSVIDNNTDLRVMNLQGAYMRYCVPYESIFSVKGQFGDAVLHAGEYRDIVTVSGEVREMRGGVLMEVTMKGGSRQLADIVDIVEAVPKAEIKKEDTVVSKAPLKYKVGDTVLYEGIAEGVRMRELSDIKSEHCALIVYGEKETHWELLREDVPRANEGRPLTGYWCKGEIVRGVGEVVGTSHGLLEVSTAYSQKHVRIPASSVATVFPKLEEGARVHVTGSYISTAGFGSVFINCAQVIIAVSDKSVTHVNGARVEETPCEGVKYAVGDILWMPGVVIYDKYNHVAGALVRLRDGSERVVRREALVVNDTEEGKESSMATGDSMEQATIEIGSVVEFDGTVTMILKDCSWLQIATEQGPMAIYPEDVYFEDGEIFAPASISDFEVGDAVTVRGAVSSIIAPYAIVQAKATITSIAIEHLRLAQPEK